MPVLVRLANARVGEDVATQTQAALSEHVWQHQQFTLPLGCI